MMFKHFFQCSMMLLIVLFSNLSFGAVINIPNDFTTIQTGIDIAAKGDTVLVDSGTYFENIKFKGKSIIVASHFILDKDPDHILKTIINGSKFTNHDSASCVMFHGEDSNAVLQGFTLTEGEGTRYTLSDLSTTTKYDGKVTVEGGGIFFNESNATVKNNLIINNQAAAISGYRYNGGGGISSFCGNPKIVNNVIMNNEAISGNGTTGYGSGIVFNESNGIVRNNIIYHNITTRICAVFSDINRGVIFENNTIVGNIMTTGESVSINAERNSVVRNNIVWGHGRTDKVSQFVGMENSVFEYCTSEAEIKNNPTILSSFPEFTESGFMLESDSPCIDAGNPVVMFNDLEDNFNLGNALFPSLGETRNDMGAYGGPYADILPNFYLEDMYVPSSFTLYSTTVNDSSTKEIQFLNLSTISMKIESLVVNSKNEFSFNHDTILEYKPMQRGVIEVTWKPQQAGNLNDTLKIYHNLKDVANPAIIKITGTAKAVTGIDDNHSANTLQGFELQQNTPNPFNPTTQIQYSIPHQEFVSLKIFDSLGREVETLVNNVQQAGNYNVALDGAHLSSGVYFYSLKAGKFSDKKKFMLLK